VTPEESASKLDRAVAQAWIRFPPPRIEAGMNLFILPG
jgi:hypothetical protein